VAVPWTLLLVAVLGILVRAAGVLSWALLTTSINQRGIASVLRLLFALLAIALAGAGFALGDGLGGIWGGAGAGSIMAMAEAYLCVHLAAGRISRMDCVQPGAQRA